MFGRRKVGLKVLTGSVGGDTVGAVVTTPTSSSYRALAQAACAGLCTMLVSSRVSFVRLNNHDAGVTVGAIMGAMLGSGVGCGTVFRKSTLLSYTMSDDQMNEDIFPSKYLLGSRHSLMLTVAVTLPPETES